MAQEEKNKLLKYLCMALSYGVIVDRLGRPRKLIGIYPFKEYCFILDNGDYMPQPYTIEDIKPYLRPMSSMTDEERTEYKKLIVLQPTDNGYDWHEVPTINALDWLLHNHFDFMGLIPMGAAIAVTEDNNPYKD